MLVLFMADQRDPAFLRGESPVRSAQRSRLVGLDDGAVLDRIQRLMRDERRYCDEDLSLTGFARELEIRPDQLSEILNQRPGKNFNAFVNQHRVAAVKVMLIETPTRSIISIAHACGFNSLRSFQTAFRRQTGLSAREFRTRALSDRGSRRSANGSGSIRETAKSESVVAATS